MEKMNISAVPFSGDIREYKKTLRAMLKQYRRELSADEKAAKDSTVTARVLASSAYKTADTILTYVSTDIEVDTMGIIRQALTDGKRVAAPRCIDGTRDMDFYYIKSADDLESGAFGVLEPDPEKCVKVTDFDNALCIIPGLAFDMEGFRLGYGKGYYDRFLSAHTGLKRMGICYCACTCSKLMHGHFDVSAELLVTEKYTRSTASGERKTNNGR